MHTYARIQNEPATGANIVAELIGPAVDVEGNEVPIVSRFTPAIVAMLVDVTEAMPMPQPNWTAAESNGVWTFSAPFSP